MKNENVEIYEVPAQEEMDLKIYGTYEERKKWNIASMDEGVLDFFVEKEFNGSTRYFLDVENVVAIAYNKPVKFHKYDPKTGMNSFDFGNDHVVTFTKEVWKEWIRQNSIWIDLVSEKICAQEQMLETFLKILKVNGLSMTIFDKKAKVLKFQPEKTGKDLRF